MNLKIAIAQLCHELQACKLESCFTREKENLLFFNKKLFYAEIQDGHQKWQENNLGDNSPVHSAVTLWVKNFVEITLSHTFIKINVFLCFTLKSKMAAKNGGKTIFGKSRQ